MLGYPSTRDAPRQVTPPMDGGTAAVVGKTIIKPRVSGWDGYAASVRQKSKARPQPRRGAPVRGSTGTGARDKR
jgi:hypothetical protein